MAFKVRNGVTEDGTYNEAGKKRYFGTTRSEKAAQTRYDNAKAAYKQANKQYSKDFDYAYNRGLAVLSPFKKHRQANQERWENVADSAKKANEAKTAMKKAKSSLKEKKKQYKEEQSQIRQDEKQQQLLSEGKKLYNKGHSQTSMNLYGAGLIAQNHIGNKLLKDVASKYLDSKATTWISKSGKTEIPVSAIARNVLTAGELFTDAYIIGKTYHNKKALDAYENRNKKK